MINTQLKAIANQISERTFDVEPWNRKELDYSQFPGKEAFCKHNRAPSTNHCYYSGFAGKDPGLRVSARNPATKMLALVVDVDEPLTQEQVDAWVATQERKPNWTSRTFSGRWRLVYLFANPVARPKCGWGPFLQALTRDLNLFKLSAAIDDVVENPSQVYELGRDWRQTSDEPIPDEWVTVRIDEAGRLAKEMDGAASIINLANIERLVHQKYPGRWTGAFEDGARGVRFWDPAADNASAAVVTPAGMRCYTGPKAFFPWKEIFGGEVVAELEEGHFDKLLPDIWFDGQRYWCAGLSGGYEDVSRQDILLRLAAKFDLPIGKNGDSEAEKALLFLQTKRRVAAAVPFLYRDRGRVSLDGEVYLNTSRVLPTRPASIPGAWSEGFPFIAGFYERFLPGDKAFDVYMTWLRHFYQGASRKVPAQGHAMVIVGKPGNGKNFQSEMIVGRLMGGSVDASSFVVGGDSYNSHYLSSPVMRIDDEAAIEDRAARRKYIATLKKLVANRRFTVSEKYLKNGSTEWMGRVVITLNDDGESLALLPTLDQSNRDKVVFIRAGDEPMPDPPEDVEEILDHELPAFGRWLLDYEPPAWLEPGGRFGFKAWQDPELLHESQLSSDGAQFEELLMLLAKDCASEKVWEGTSTELQGALVGNQKLAAQVRSMSADYVGRQLGKLQDREYLQKLKRKRGRGWRIDFETLRAEA